MPSYYDIDSILAEEELVPCTTLFDFSHMAHLDPDAHHHVPSYSSSEKRKKGNKRQHHLPEGSRIKMPLWAIDKWATLGFVRVGLPRHFGRRARERLEADPGSANLRSRNERFFMAGLLLVNLIDRCSSAITAAVLSASGRRGGNNGSRRNAHAAAMMEVQREAGELRRTLLVTYTGERLRRIFDWTLSSINDDVTSFTKRLTELELRLFKRGASAAAAHAAWKEYGSRRIAVSQIALRANAIRNRVAYQTPQPGEMRAVTPDNESRRKRVRVA